ncbi:MAG: DUF6356 family protein [Litoreibacter sp.]
MLKFLATFRDHPASVGENYLSHMRFALWFSGTLLGAALAALIHALIPPLFETTASRMVGALYHRTHNRVHRDL